MKVGLRGDVPVLDGTLDWKLGLFRIDSSDDIIQVASVIQGRGSFQNVPETRRQGVEAGAQYQSSRWLAYVGYSFLDATYQFTGTLPSPNNPFADADGTCAWCPGKNIRVSRSIKGIRARLQGDVGLHGGRRRRRGGQPIFRR